MHCEIRKGGCVGEEAKVWFWGGTALIPERAGGLLEDAAIGVSGNRIVFIGTRSEAKPAATARKIDTTGCLVMPGLINGHSHVGMTLLRGFADDRPFQNWLFDKILPTEKKFATPEFVYWGAMLASCEMIRAGVTSFNDMYHFEAQAARAADEAGLRMVAGMHFDESMLGPSPSSDRLSAIAKFVDPFLEEVSSYPRVTPSVAPHAIYSVSLDSWKAIIAYVEKRKIRIHFHLEEVQSEVDACIKANGKTPTQVFNDLGLWEQKVTAAHAVCLNEADRALLGSKKVGVSHNIESNMKLGAGIAPVVEMRRAGMRVALGTDSTASNNNLDLLGEADFAAKLQAFKYGPGALRSEEVFAMLTSEGAEAIGLGDSVGRLEVGYVADLIAVEVSAPHAVPIYNPYSHLVYSASGRDVRHTMVNGEMLMENRTLKTLDEQEILREAVSWARRIAT
jgi:5-methylthioadenosine/S-adenosylhomocysteine deaminase